MYARSADFDAAIVNSHQVVAKAELLADGVKVDAVLEVTGGSVTVDATAAVRRICTLTVVDPAGTFTPTGATSGPLAPYGTEIRLYRGIRLASGDEYLPLGVFRVAAASLIDTGTRTWQIAGYDRSRTIARARLTDVYIVPAGTNYATAIQLLLSASMDGLTFSFATTGYTTPQIVLDAEADPWQAALGMADSVGCELFFDQDGVCVLRAVPDPSVSPTVWVYAEGPQAIMLGVERDFDDDPGYNGVVVFGETTDNTTPVRAESWDANTSSDTNYLGRYGKVPRFERSTLVTTTEQAQEAADAMVRRLLGVTEQVKFTSIVHPAHDAGDVVGVVRAGVGLSDVFVLESFTLPLDHNSPLTAACRRKKAAA